MKQQPCWLHCSMYTPFWCFSMWSEYSQMLSEINNLMRCMYSDFLCNPIHMLHHDFFLWNKWEWRKCWYRRRRTMMILLKHTIFAPQFNAVAADEKLKHCSGWLWWFSSWWWSPWWWWGCAMQWWWWWGWFAFKMIMTMTHMASNFVCVCILYGPQLSKTKLSNAANRWLWIFCRIVFFLICWWKILFKTQRI